MCILAITNLNTCQISNIIYLIFVYIYISNIYQIHAQVPAYQVADQAKKIMFRLAYYKHATLSLKIDRI